MKCHVRVMANTSVFLAMDGGNGANGAASCTMRAAARFSMAWSGWAVDFDPRPSRRLCLCIPSVAGCRKFCRALLRGNARCPAVLFSGAMPLHIRHSLPPWRRARKLLPWQGVVAFYAFFQGADLRVQHQAFLVAVIGCRGRPTAGTGRVACVREQHLLPGFSWV